VDSIWILGDQLSEKTEPLHSADPNIVQVVMIESRGKIEGRPWHRQRLHLYLASMRRFADSLRTRGFVVDYRVAPDFRSGLMAHRVDYSPETITVGQPTSRAAVRLAEELGIVVVSSGAFLTEVSWFASLLERTSSLTMETFYRAQRIRLDVLVDGTEPVGGRWNYDTENRRPLPKDGGTWPEPVVDPLDDLDRAVLADLPVTCVGDDPIGLWPTSREAALRRLEHALAHCLTDFGPYEDSMSADNWHLSHTLLSPALNLGLLHPQEVVDAAVQAYEQGHLPLSSVEGFIRQIIGWREYVWCRYWTNDPSYGRLNFFDAHAPLPAAMAELGGSTMGCLNAVLADVRAYGWTHHINRLMILSSIALTNGVQPHTVVRWMCDVFVDAAEWVMEPNVIGMGLYADGGQMATKPYLSGGNYVHKMGNYCRGCQFVPTARDGAEACPLTVWYWAFLAEQSDRLRRNPRVAAQVSAAGKRPDRHQLHERADQMRAQLQRGEL
jgi:deoxyribodipyrimidine photolyase-related protein